MRYLFFISMILFFLSSFSELKAQAKTVDEAAQAVNSLEIPRYSSYLSGKKTYYKLDKDGPFCFHEVRGYIDCQKYKELLMVDSDATTNRLKDQADDEHEDESDDEEKTEPTEDQHHDLPCAPIRSLEKPIDSILTSPFGMRKHPITRRRKMHAGCDFRASIGTPIKAAATGKVLCGKGQKDKKGRPIIRQGGYGIAINMVHGDGLTTRYAHLESIKMEHCDKFVSAGTIIGYADNTGRSKGSHLHFEVRCNDEPQDPRPYFSLADERPTHAPRIGH